MKGIGSFITRNAKGKIDISNEGQADFKYDLQHERPCCISIYKLEPKAGVVYLIQHGGECYNWLVKLSNFIDLFAR